MNGRTRSWCWPTISPSPGRWVPAVLLLLTLLATATMMAADQPAGTAPAAPRAAASPDTLEVRFSWRDGDEPAPVALHVVPTLVDLGGLVAVVSDGPAGVALPAGDRLQADVEWLVPEPRPIIDEAVAAAIDALPDAQGPRSITFWRAYVLGMWRATWADRAPGTLVTVQGRLAGSEPIMPVRDPRLPGGLPRWLVWLIGFALLLALAWLGWRRLRRRQDPSRQAEDQPLEAPAWLRAACDLHALDRSGVDGRSFLDRLAAILRRYLQERFYLPAVEMTVAELAAAARSAGWRDHQIAGFLAILAECDRLRYAPPGISALACRDCLGAALDAIEGARIVPIWSPAAAQQVAAARAAWQDLRARHPGDGAAAAGGGAC